MVFTYKHFDDSKKQIIIEYQLFLLPISLASLFSSYWYCFSILHFIVFCIPFIQLKTKIQFKFLFLTRLLKNDYIFISGIRKNLIVLLVFALLALLLSPLKLFPLVALFLFNSVVFSFYEPSESVQMLQASNQSPKQFMTSLFNAGITKLAVINFPILLINSLFNPDLWMFNFYFFAYNMLILATVIALKYESYDFKKSGNNFQIKLIIMILGLFIPYLCPLAIVFYFQSRSGAIKNLNTYLDVSN